MKKLFKKAKKGFTIVELVIVIGVIAILSAILIPTFVNLTAKANEAALQSNLANAYTEYYAEALDNDQLADAPRTEVYLSTDKDLVDHNDVDNPSITYYTCDENGVWSEKTAKIVAGEDHTFASVYTLDPEDEEDEVPSFGTYYVFYIFENAQD